MSFPDISVDACKMAEIRIQDDQCVKENVNNDEAITLEVLPAEIFLHICSFIDAKFVIHSLSQVCKYFNSLINDDVFWKIRIGKRWPKKYPAIPGMCTQANLVIFAS